MKDSKLQKRRPKKYDVSDAVSSLDSRMKAAVRSGDKGLYDRLNEFKQQLTKTWAEDSESGSIKPVADRPMQMTPYEAAQLKRQVGDMTRWTGSDPFENQVNAAKADVFGKIKDQINTAVPGVKELNSRYADLVGAGKAVERRAPIAARNSDWNLSDIGTAAVGELAAGAPVAAGMVIGKKILGMPSTRIGIAKAISPEGNVLAKPTPRSVVVDPATGRPEFSDVLAKQPKSAGPSLGTPKSLDLEPSSGVIGARYPILDEKGNPLGKHYRNARSWKS